LGSRFSTSQQLAPSALSRSTASWFSGWPMKGHDPQRSYQSTIAGPLQPRLVFKRTGVAVLYVGSDGTMYGSVKHRNENLWREAAFSPTGRLRWSKRARLEGELAGVGPTGTVLQFDDMKASGYSPRGKRLWTTPTLGLLKGESPLITQTGTVFAPVVGPHASVYATRIGINVMAASGKLLGLFPGEWHSPAMSPSGTIYLIGLGSTVLEARTSSGAGVWHLDLGGMSNSILDPCVGNSGNIYVGDGEQLIAVGPNGQKLWTAQKQDGVLAVASRGDGTILAAGRDELGAFGADGDRLWSLAIGRSGDQLPSYRPSLIVDAIGTAYVGSGDGNVLVVSHLGKVLARLTAGGRRSQFPPQVLLGPNGHLVVSGQDGTLRVYAP
jgi:hypothetical protein